MTDAAIHERPSRAKQCVQITLKLTEDEVSVLDDMMRAGKWPNRTTLVISMLKSIIEDELNV